MPNIHLITVGRLKSGPMKEAFDEYRKRIKWSIKLDEIDIRDGGNRQQALENQEILIGLHPNHPTFILDERGKTMASPAFAKTIENHFENGQSNLQFVIGGADGLLDEVRARAQHLVSFGAMTWPHMMVRVMLVEQLYRAQQILAGHPYHRGD